MNKVKVKEEIKMKKKFGIFNSVEELNRAAAGQLKEGDIEALKELAKENGIDADDVEDYVEGYTDELATPLTAALGKIEIEVAEITHTREKIPCRIIANMTKGMLTDINIANSVMKKDKKIQDITAIMCEMQCNMGTDRELEEIIKTYFLEDYENTKNKVKEISEKYKGE